jgi:DNA modification methylase
MIPTAGQTGESKKFGHPAMFPEIFARDFISSWSNPKDMIFDPFMGSGTVAVASLYMNRKFVGCEISKPYYKIAKRRIKHRNFAKR